MTQPLITIGITCFNAAKTIGGAIECALAQDWRNKEILVVDDGSCDDSVNIVEAYAANNATISLIRHKTNKGCPSARNTILTNFKGEYLAFFDDDDYSYPTRLTDQYERIITSGKNKKAVLCFSHIERVEAGETEPSRIMKGMGWRSPEPDGEMLAGKFFLDKSYPNFSMGIIGTCCLMAHKDVFAQIGEFDVQLPRAEDLDYAIRAGGSKVDFVAVDKVLVRYFIHPERKKKEKIIQSNLYLAKKYKNYLVSHGMYTYFLIMAHANAHEFCQNKWRFKILRSLAKRVKRLSNAVQRMKNK